MRESKAQYHHDRKKFRLGFSRWILFCSNRERMKSNQEVIKQTLHTHPHSQGRRAAYALRFPYLVKTFYAWKEFYLERELNADEILWYI